MPILFHKDWKNDKGNLVALPHITTKNQSFLRTCMLLKKMGITNYAFPLALYDQDLKDVNPHDLEENTEENEFIRAKVQIEARRNVWYYLRECARVYNPGGDSIPFRLDRGSLAMTWCFNNGIDYCGIQPRQTGKFQPLHSLVKTPSGFVKMGDIKLGQLVSTPDGYTAPVKGIYPQGKKPIYRIHFEDWRFTDCGLDHLWKVYVPEHNRMNGGEWKVLTLNEILSMFLDEETNNKIYIPLSEPEIKDSVDLPIDPYVLGVILSKGSFRKNIVTIDEPNKWIRDEVVRLLPDGYDVINHNETSFSITETEDVVPFHVLLNELGFFTETGLTNLDYIPEIYMNSSYSQKINILQGLFDSNGIVKTYDIGSDKITPKHCTVEYITESSTISNQVQTLIRSLGGVCKILPRKTYFSYKGVSHKDIVSYVITYKLKDRSLVFRLPNKKLATLTSDYKYNNDLKLAIRFIEYVGEEECQCIEVDHPDHLYITDDYIVTHNTVCALTLTTWILFTSGLNFQIGMMAKDNSLREENVKRIKDFEDCLPSWWVAKDRNHDKRNASGIYYSELKTHYVTYVAQPSPAAADKQARGSSPPVFHFDEFEYIENIDTSYATILSSTSASRISAKNNGLPHSNIITTTTGDPKRKECKAAAKILSGAMDWTETLFDCEDKESLDKIVSANSPQKLIIGMFSHLQLGYSNQWLADIIHRSASSKDKILRDFLNRRVSVQEDPIIPADILNKINASQMEPLYHQILSNKYIIRWYVPKAVVNSDSFKNKVIIVGCDSSEMIGRDSTTLVGIDPTDLSVLFTFKCNEGNLNIVAVTIAHLMTMYPKMILVPENKSSGTSFIDTISLLLRKEKHNPFRRIFNWVVNNYHEKEFSSIDIKDTSLLDTSIKKYFGIKTDKGKRDELYSNVLLEGASVSASRIRDQSLISELSSLVVRNGRVDHGVGGNDDMCIAWLMSVWFVLNAKHLDMYGITPGSVMSTIDKTNNLSDRQLIQKQDHLLKQIADLEDAMKRQADVGTRRMIQTNLQILKDDVAKVRILMPQNADDVRRDPTKYIDSTVAPIKSDQVSSETLEKSLRTMLNMV